MGMILNFCKLSGIQLPFTLLMEFSKMQHLLFEGSSETLDPKCPLD